MKARANHKKEKPNALNISKAVSHNMLRNKFIFCLLQSSVKCEMIDRDSVRCIESEKIRTCDYLKNVT